MKEREFLTFDEAVALRQISRVTLWRRIRTGHLTSYRDGVDLRRQFVKRSELETLLQPTKIVDTEKKAAA
jgi:hypothetical protein